MRSIKCLTLLLISSMSFGLQSDINHDGRVDLLDLSILSDEWLKEEHMSSLQNACKAHFKLNDCAISKAVINSVGQPHGVSVRNTNLMAVPGKLLGALEFNGTTDIITIPHHVNLEMTLNFTVSFWGNSFNGYEQYIMKKGPDSYGRSWYLWNSGPEYITFTWEDGFSDNASFGAPVPIDGDWHHIVFSIWSEPFPSTHRAQCIVYVDGVAQPVQEAPYASADICSNGMPVQIGKDYTGALDNIMIFQRTLTAPEVAVLWNGGLGCEDWGEPYLFQNSIREYFKNNIASVYEITTQYDNQAMAKPATPWCRLTILPGESNQFSLGIREFRTVGIMEAQLFYPIETGDAAALKMARRIENVFKGLNLDRGIQFKTPVIKNIGRMNAEYQINVTCPFYVNE